MRLLFQKPYLPAKPYFERFYTLVLLINYAKNNRQSYTCNECTITSRVSRPLREQKVLNSPKLQTIMLSQLPINRNLMQ